MLPDRPSFPNKAVQTGRRFQGQHRDNKKKSQSSTALQHGVKTCHKRQQAWPNLLTSKCRCTCSIMHAGRAHAPGHLRNSGTVCTGTAMLHAWGVNQKSWRPGHTRLLLVCAARTRPEQTHALAAAAVARAHIDAAPGPAAAGRHCGPCDVI
jgi:hypothetical protein